MKIYCSGIGGIGLSAYASLQKQDGHDVMGSDRTASLVTDQLQASGIPVIFEQDGSGIPDGLDLFVYSEAIPTSSPERLRASELNIKQISYPEALSNLTQAHTLVAVCGTHGKSTTTAMAARLLIETGRDPTVVVGTMTHELGERNWRRGSSSLFLVEACEYRKSFHFFQPQIILLTNCDGDHFDSFVNLEQYQEAFVEFLQHLPASGTVITHMSDPDCRKIAEASGRAILDADQFPLIDLSAPGLHMKQNAQLVLALAQLMAIDAEDAAEALAGFQGTWRRMEVKGIYRDDIVVVDDYAHHPREIRATLNAMKSRYPQRRIVCVFQPHMHNRTLRLYDDFATAFTDADVVIVPNVYDARSDTETELVDVPDFVKRIAKESSVEAIDGESLKATQSLLKKSILKAGDLVIFMGAGDITDLATAFALHPMS